jgi:hypothetical protein
MIKKQNLKKINGYLGEDLLSNNELQVLKPQLDNVLSVNNVQIISRKEDGYINLNQLCKAGKKDFRAWKKTKRAKSFLVELSKTLNEGDNADKKEGGTIVPDTLIKYKAGSNIERTNWGHPQVAINVAQWISTEFDVQVSNWVFQLIVTGSVTLGNEMSPTQLDLEYKKKLNQVQQDYTKLRQLHNSLKFKRNYHELEKGNCVYVCHNKLEPPDRYKIGKTDNINKTLRVYRRNAPYTLLDYLFFTNKSTLLEDSLLTKYLSERRPMNHEVVENTKLETIIYDMKKIVEFINIPGSEGSQENTEKYNDDINTPDIEVVGNDNMFIIESDDDSDTEDENIKIKERVEEVEKRVEKIEEVQEEQEGCYDKLLKEMENYTDKKLKEMLVQLKLPVSGVKDVKKRRIRTYFEKSGKTKTNINISILQENRICDTCGEDKLLDKKHYRVFGYGFKKRCLECDIKSCQTIKGVRKDIYTEIKEKDDTTSCSKCKKIVSIEDFYKNSANKSGRESQCKNCSSKNKNKKLNGGVLKFMRKIYKRPDNVGNDEKWCTDCKNIKSKDEFRKRAAASDGCQTYCRECDNARSRKNRMKKKIVTQK